MSKTRSIRSARGDRRNRRSTVDLRSSILAWEIDPRVRRATGAISAEELEALIKEEQTLLDYVDTLEAHARRLKRGESLAPKTPSPFELADTRVDAALSTDDIAETRVRYVPSLPRHSLEMGELREPQTDELRVAEKKERTEVRMPVELGAFELRRTYKRDEPGRVETLEPVEIPTKIGLRPGFIPNEPSSWEREKEGARRRASARRRREAELRAPKRESSTRWRERQDARPTGPMRMPAPNGWYQQVISTTQEIYYRTVQQARFSFRGVQAQARRQLDRTLRAMRSERAHPFIEVPRPWYQAPSALASMGLGMGALLGLLYLIS